MFNFRNIVEDCGFVDLGFSGSIFIWNNKSEGIRNVHERLDCFFATQKWVDLFSEVKVEHLEFMFFDHRPILAKFAVGSVSSTVVKEKKFIFEPFSLKDEDCYSVKNEHLEFMFFNPNQGLWLC
ncbi:hypothetical protein ACOSP7_007012 [Xanthoceras sorbifolium]